MSTGNAFECAKACQEAQALIAEVRRGCALPDALHVALQRVRASGDGDRLRTFTRTVQKAIEASTRAGR